MALKNHHIELKNILQDTVMKIPFFLSHLPTNILALEYQSNIIHYLQQNTSIHNLQIRLYFYQQKPFKTIILQFKNAQIATEFKLNHEVQQNKFSHHNQQFLAKFNKPIVLDHQSSPIFKAKFYYCKDITFLDGILYECGRVAVANPPSKIMDSIIKQVSKMVVVEGIGLQQELKEQSNRQQCLEFINHKLVSSENIYYRWKVYSYMQGDRDRNYRTMPFQFAENGPLWFPPPLNPKYSSKLLNLEERLYFTKLLNQLVNNKRKIEQAMAFSIYNIQCAVDICCIMTVKMGELCQEETTVEKFLPFIYLLSDIFFNSPTPVYRDMMSIILPSILSKLIEKVQVVDKLWELAQTWKSKYVFEEDYFKGIFWILHSKTSVISQQVVEEIKIKTEEEIQSFCYNYGLPYSYQNHQKNVDSLILMLSNEKMEERIEEQPNTGAYDGQQLTEKDIQKIKSKLCKAVSCQGTTIKSLFEKGQTKYSLSFEKE